MLIHKIRPGYLGYFSYKIRLLRETSDSVEAAITRQLEEFHRRMSKVDMGLLEHVYQDLEHVYEDAETVPEEFFTCLDLEEEKEFTEDEFTQLLRQSLFITAYSLLEKHFDGVCDGLKKHLKLALSQSDLRHRGIERSKVYLTKVGV